MKKILAFLLSIIMVLSMCNVNYANAATNPKKQGWVSSMVVGEAAAFGVTNATGYIVTWESSKTGVATVQKKTGAVKAIKAGVTEITANLTKGKKVVTLSGKLKVVSEQNTVVSTEFGKVEGIKNGKNVTWYGIPYGAEPVGNLRWKLPQDPKVWTETRDCTKKEAVALQYSAAAKSVTGSTDCLNMDIYATTAQGSKLPVFVFFHGGNNQTGSSFGDITGTDMVINDDCIVVSVNYRLGLLGFNCLPALMTGKDASGNFAFYDMQKALQWVQKNISQFGGDPSNVTVSGHSAGGRDVMAMLISPIFKGLFQKAVVSSGGMTISDETKSASQIAAFIAPLAVKHAKFATEKEAQAWLLTNGADVKEFLFSLTSEELMAAVGDAAIRMSAFPHLYADGVAIPTEGFDSKTYNDVPVMMITGSDEFSFFNGGAAYTDGSISADELAAAKAFGSKYGSQMYGYFNANASAQKMLEKGYQSPIYLMNCNFGHDSAIWKDMPMGSFHGVVLGFLDTNCGVRSYFSAAYATNGGKQLLPLTNQYMKNFLWSSTGDPNSNGITGWSAYTSASSKWLVLDADRETAWAKMDQIAITSYDQVFTAMDADTTISSAAKASVIKSVLNGRWFSRALDTKYNNANLWR